MRIPLISYRNFKCK